MHNLALALNKKGLWVSGSDDEIFEPARTRLQVHGLLPEKEGWFPEKLDTTIEAVILGMHAKKDNPELLRAQELGIRIYSYPEFLYEQSKDKYRVVVGGSHGKTTITAMILHALQHAGVETDFMVGAKLEGFDVMVRLTETAKYMVFEGDEYLTSPIDPRPKFHLYKPHLGLISGIAWDHINVFPTFERYVDQFRQFIDLVEEGGELVYCAEDGVLKDLCGEKETGRTITKTPYRFPLFSINEGVTCVTSENTTYPLSVFGRHNLLNAVGASILCDRMGVPGAVFWSSMKSFRGASNRLELIGRSDETLVYKDFAHAPSKVEATIRAMKEQYPDRSLFACFELHTYSSLSREFLSHYAGSLDMADEAVVYYNPHAIQLKRLPNLDPDDIKQGFARKGLRVFSSSEALQHYLLSQDWKNTNLLFMSSGNFDGMNLDRFCAQILGEMDD